MRAPSLILSPTRSFDLRYTVYLSEIKKRLAYAGLSFLLALCCAYGQRVSLMYSITLSLQGANARLAPTEKDGPRQTLFDLPFASSLGHVEDTDALLALQNMQCTAELCTQNEVLHEVLHVLQHHLGIVNQALYTNESVRLIFTDVEEAFYTLLSISLFYCLLVCLPVFLYYALCFFQPGFYAWQSQRVWLFVSLRILFVYLVLKLVDLFVIPRLLKFFYSFEIQRNSLCLHAETKVISYVSLYVFVYFLTVMLLVVTGAWSFYKQREVLRLLLTAHSLPESNLLVPTSLTHMSASKQQPHSLSEQEGGWRHDQYKSQRSKVWWGCLLLAALLSPPEIISQLAYAFFLILCSEISVWLAYMSSCRLYNKMSFSSNKA